VALLLVAPLPREIETPLTIMSLHPNFAKNQSRAASPHTDSKALFQNRLRAAGLKPRPSKYQRTSQ
jgi:hypothetical protein